MEQLVEKLAISAQKIEKVIQAFCIHENDPDIDFSKVGNYNKAANCPIIVLRDGTLISFLDYGAFSALYENPFYWITRDKSYLGTHSQTRGSFTEKFTDRTLRKVFPDQYVFRNVIFRLSAGDAVGEADVILIYGYRAFIVQAKSKRLTLASWAGDDIAIANDFKKAVQEAYDQAVECVSHINNDVMAYINDVPIDLKKFGEIREFYPICVTSENYPALAFQNSTSLQLQEAAKMYPPIVTDLFTLDVMSEMLETPFYFTDYLVKRAKASGRLHISHELVALSWYIKKNLHVEDNEFVHVADDYMVELDLAIAVRKMGIEGQATPEGQLTRFRGPRSGSC